MAANPRRTMSDIRPSRGMDGVVRATPGRPAVVGQRRTVEPVQKKSNPAPRVVEAPVMETTVISEPVAQGVIPDEDLLAVEEHEILMPPKRRRGRVLKKIIGFLIFAGCLYGIYLIYLANYR